MWWTKDLYTIPFTTQPDIVMQNYTFIMFPLMGQKQQISDIRNIYGSHTN